MVETLPTVYATPPSTEVVAIEKGADLLKTLLTNDFFSMVGGVVTCELLQNVVVREFTPAHWHHRVVDGHAYWEYVPEQPRQMLLSQLLSSSMETAIIGSIILKSITADLGGMGDIISLIKLVTGK